MRTASRTAVKVSLLQHLGPPISPMASSALAVIRLESPQDFPARGVAPVTMLMKMPALTPAPQQPQKPQTPPGIWLPLSSICLRASSRQICPPQLW